MVWFKKSAVIDPAKRITEAKERLRSFLQQLPDVEDYVILEPHVEERLGVYPSGRTLKVEDKSEFADKSSRLQVDKVAEVLPRQKAG